MEKNIEDQEDQATCLPMICSFCGEGPLSEGFIYGSFRGGAHICRKCALNCLEIFNENEKIILPSSEEIEIVIKKIMESQFVEIKK